MTYILMILATAVSAAVTWCFLDEDITDRICPGRERHLPDAIEETENPGESGEDAAPGEDKSEDEKYPARWTPSKRVHIVLTAILTAISAGSMYQLFRVNPGTINILKMLVILYGVIAAGCMDLREQRISNRITGSMAAAGILLLAVGVVTGQNGALSYVNSGVFAAAVCGVAGLLLYVLTRKGIGEGDIKLVCAMAITGGVYVMIGTLFLASILSAAAAVFLLATRRMTMKSQIPFGPFIMLGCLITIIMLQF